MLIHRRLVAMRLEPPFDFSLRRKTAKPAGQARPVEWRPDAARAKVGDVAGLLDVAARYPPWFTAHARMLLARTAVLLGDGPAARSFLAAAERDVLAMPDAVGLVTAFEEARRIVGTAGSDVEGAPGLTAAEGRVLQYLPTHLSFREVGERLFISRNTVKTHALSVYRKLGVSSRSEAVARARELQLLDPDGGPAHPNGLMRPAVDAS